MPEPGLISTDLLLVIGDSAADDRLSGTPVRTKTKTKQTEINNTLSSPSLLEWLRCTDNILMRFLRKLTIVRPGYGEHLSREVGLLEKHHSITTYVIEIQRDFVVGSSCIGWEVGFGRGAARCL